MREKLLDWMDAAKEWTHGLVVCICGLIVTVGLLAIAVYNSCCTEEGQMEFEVRRMERLLEDRAGMQALRERHRELCLQLPEECER